MKNEIDNSVKFHFLPAKSETDPGQHQTEGMKFVYFES